MLKKNPLVSIILRSYNEEKWIGACLDAIMTQKYKNFEIILVDNNSTDMTVSKAKQYPVKLLNIDKFMPGLALNLGIRASKGEYLVCMSGHCIPTNELWLENLLKNFDDPKVAAVYGRQEPMSFTPDTDKRDLLTVFGLDRKVQWKDSFFHNANSMLRRDLWEKTPFDEAITNIEDRLWAREILKLGYCIVYEPESSVYHWHGIHQNQNAERCANVVRIIEGLFKQDGDLKNYSRKENINVAAIIPAKGDVLYTKSGVPLLKYTLDYLKKSKLIKDIVLSTDSPEYIKLAKELGVKHIFQRDNALAKDFVDLMAVYQDAISQMAKNNLVPDVVIPMEMTFPFRDENLIDRLVDALLEGGHDAVVPVKAEHGSVWKNETNQWRAIADGFVPRKYKDPMMIGLKGLGFAIYPGKILKGNIIDINMKLLEVANPLSSVEIRNSEDLVLTGKILEAWSK
jgi:glycosyltransferase involved in cell wall biosynthesis